MKSRLVFIFLLFICFFLSNSCDKKEDKYVGVNEIYLSTPQSTTLVIGESSQEITAKLTLTRKVEKATQITLKVINPTDANTDLVEILPKTVLVESGKREAEFKIKLKQGVSIIESQKVIISTETQNTLKPKENLEITIKPAISIQGLTAVQKKLVLGYKSKGIDIAPFLGKQKVKVTINSAADGYLKGFGKAFTKVFEGITVITLSDSATAEKAVLKMSENPMGMTEFFYFLMRKETIENDEYFYALPNSPKVMKLINWNKTSKEEFSVNLDGIEIQAAKNGISPINYVGKGKDSYGDTIDVVPFKFSYTAWDRLKQMIDKGNKEAIEYHTTGSTSYPYFYLNNTTISKDEYTSGAYKKTSGSIDHKNGIMTFEFLSSHTNGGDYLTIKAEYSIK